MKRDSIHKETPNAVLKHGLQLLLTKHLARVLEDEAQNLSALSALSDSYNGCTFWNLPQHWVNLEGCGSDCLTSESALQWHIVINEMLSMMLSKAKNGSHFNEMKNENKG